MALVSVSLYEGQWSLLSQTARAFPYIKSKELKPQSKEYLSTHLLSSGVYYILKMFEKSVPALCVQLVKFHRT